MVPWSQLRKPCLGWMRTDLTSEFTHFNLVIRSSNVKQSAFPFSTFCNVSPLCCLCDTLELSSLLKWSRSKQPETSFWADAHVSDATCNMTDEPGGYIPSRCGDSFLLMVFWWGSRFRASNSLELEQPFMPVWLDRPRSRFGSNARLLRSDLSPFNFILFFRSCHQLVPHSVLPPCPSVMCRGVQVCALCWLGPFHRVGWFWRSVCSLSPPALFWPLPVVCVRFFLPLPFQGRPGSGRVCVCVRVTPVQM